MNSIKYIVLYLSLGLGTCVMAQNPISLPTNPHAELEPTEFLQTHYVVDATNLVQAGDVLHYQVLEDQDPSIMLKVDANGQVMIPYYGAFKVVGQTPAQIAEAVKQQLESTYYSTATVIIQLQSTPKGRKLGTVYLSGKFNRIGPVQFDIDTGTTLSRAILSAGGFSDFADSKKVKVIRKTLNAPDEQIVVNVERILEKGQQTNDIQVQDGDLIIAPQKIFNW